MPIPAFDVMVGTLVAANLEFFDDTGEPADPTTVTAAVRTPSGTYLDPAPIPTQQGVGIYRIEFMVTAAGLWVVQGRGEGEVDVVNESYFPVRANMIPLA